MKSWACSAGIAAMILAIALPAAAQVAPPPATREEIQRIPVTPDARAPSRLTVEGGIERAPCPLADPRFAGITVTLTAAMFDDLRVVPAETLRPAYESFIGKTVPISAVCEIRDAAATILRREGYLAAVQVPAQRIENGVVHFTVLMAKLVAVQVRGNAGKSERLIASYLDQLKSQEVFNERQAERYLLLARDIPGFDVRLTLRSAGTVPGEVVGEVTVVRQAGSVDANIQNYGSHDVGRFGALIRGELYDVLGSGDRLTLGLFATPQFREQHVVQVGYDRRLGNQGLVLGPRFTYAWTQPDLGSSVAGRIKSDTLVATFEGSYPFLRSQSQNLRAVLGFDFIEQRVRLAGAGTSIRISRDKLRVLYGRLDFDTIDRSSLKSVTGFSASEPRFRFAGSIEARKGLDILEASGRCGPAPFVACAPPQVSLSRVEGRPTAAILRLSGIAEFRPQPRLAFTLAPRAQIASHALLSYEEFSGGNYTVGRGYDAGTVIGDDGLGFQAEVRIGTLVPRSRDSFAFQPYAFFDRAWVWNRDQPFRPLHSDPQTLSSAGAGLRAAYGDHARIDVTLAVPLEKAGLFYRKPDPRLLVSFTTRLLPWTR